MALALMRRHRRWLFGFLWLVILAFIILYIPMNESANGSSPGGKLAEVGDLPITVAEYQRAYERQREMYQSMSQRQLDPEMLRRLGVEEQTLQALVDERVLLLEAGRLGLEVDDEAVRRHLETAPEYQIDGRFMGGAELRRRLDRAGIAEKDFLEQVRGGLLRQKLVALVTDGINVTAADAEREYRRRNERLTTEYVLVAAETGKATVSEDEVKARFETRKESYRFPERRIVSYVMLEPTALVPRVTVTERDVQAYYEAHREELKSEEEVCASHVLVKVKAPGAPAAEGHSEEEARRLAQAALDEVRGGTDFAAVAKRVSEDQGSGPGGGDLGCFGRGRMVPPFENAAFALEPGTISDLVRSDFGFHVIRVSSRKEETVPSLSQVKDRLQQMVKGERVRALAEEKAQAIAAALARGRSLEDAAKEQGLAVQKSPPLVRGEALPPLSSPALVARAFELKRGEAGSEPFALPSGYAFIALHEVQPARVPELKEVQDKVRADVLQEKAFEAARARAAEVRTRAEAAGLDKAASAFGLVRKETSLLARGESFGDLGTGAVLEEAAFALAPGALSEPVRVASGYAVLRVLERKPVDPVAFEKEKASLMVSLRDERREQLFRAFLSEARKRFPVQKNAEALRRAVG